jgi:ferric-dicitrate binding protein FerR (iron transport regulator)
LPPVPDAPQDAALEALAADLSAAGARSRRARKGAATPRPAYAAAIRERLLSGAPSAAAETEGALAIAPLPPEVVPLAASAVAEGQDIEAPELAAGTRPPEPALRVERRRYRRPDPSPEAVSPWAAERAAAPPAEAATRARTPWWRPMRLAAVALALVVVAAGAFGAGKLLLFRTSLNAVAGEVAGATLTRGGQSSELLSGTALLEGDTIGVAPGGHAALAIGGSIARLAGGAAVHLDALGAQGVTIGQLAGRAYHRVDPSDGLPYRVATGPLTWTASGTAFDVDREPVTSGQGAGGERVTLLAIQHDVALAGPGLEVNVTEGQQAVVYIGGSGPLEPAIAPAEQQALQDPWLLANGGLDASLGFPVGVLAAVLPSPSPSPSPSATPDMTPGESPSGEVPASPSPSGTSTSEPTAPPTAKPTATPSPSPSPTPKPTPGLATLDLTLRACPGGVVIDWSAYGGSGFHHYTTLRNSVPEIPLAYPPQGGAVDFGGTYTTVRTKTDAIDGDPSQGIRYYYRSMAFSASGKVIGASALKSVVGAGGALDLGALSVSGDASALSFHWTAYGGGANCFSAYKLVYSVDDANPSYLKGSALLWGGGGASYSGLDGLTIDPGTYWFRIQALRVTSLGQFVTAQSDVRHCVVASDSVTCDP